MDTAKNRYGTNPVYFSRSNSLLLHKVNVNWIVRTVAYRMSMISQCGIINVFTRICPIESEIINAKVISYVAAEFVIFTSLGGAIPRT